MVQKKEEVLKSISIPMFNSEVRVCICNRHDEAAFAGLCKGMSEEEAASLMTVLMSDNVRGLRLGQSYRMSNGIRLYQVLIIKSDYEQLGMAGALVHELSLVTSQILNDHKVKDDETRSYLIGYLYSEAIGMVREICAGAMGGRDGHVMKTVAIPMLKTNIRVCIANKHDEAAFEDLCRGLPDKEASRLKTSMKNSDVRGKAYCNSDFSVSREDILLALVFRNSYGQLDMETTLVHELSHITTHLLENCGIKDEETRGYVLEYLYSETLGMVIDDCKARMEGANMSGKNDDTKEAA